MFVIFLLDSKLKKYACLLTKSFNINGCDCFVLVSFYILAVVKDMVIILTYKQYSFLVVPGNYALEP